MTKTFVRRKVLSFHSTEYLVQFSLQPSAGEGQGAVTHLLDLQAETCVKSDRNEEINI